MEWIDCPLIYLAPRDLLDCCRWVSFLEDNLKGTLKEVMRLEAFDKEREGIDKSLGEVKLKLLNLTRRLRLGAAQSNSTRRKVIINFIENNKASWNQANQWFRSQSKEVKILSEHVFPVGKPLVVFVQTIKEQLQSALVVFEGEAAQTSGNYHPDCTTKYIELHTQIVPHLLRLQLCDTILQNIVYMKKAKLFLKHQVQEARSFLFDFAPEPIQISIPTSMPQIPQFQEDVQLVVETITLHYNEPSVERPVTIRPFLGDLEMNTTTVFYPVTVPDNPPVPSPVNLVDKPVTTRRRKQAMSKSDVPKKRGRPALPKTGQQPAQSAEPANRQAKENAIAKPGDPGFGGKKIAKKRKPAP